MFTNSLPEGSYDFHNWTLLTWSLMPVTSKFHMLTWCTISQIIQVVSRDPEISRRLERSKDTHVTISAQTETFPTESYFKDTVIWKSN